MMNPNMSADLKISVSSEVQLSSGLRMALFVGINVAVLMTLVVGMSMSSPANPRFIYVILITALCTGPLLWLERINGPYFLLMAYLGFFYIFFGFGDLMSILAGMGSEGSAGVLGAGEAVILTSGLGVVVGYYAAVRWAGPKPADTGAISKDWAFPVVVVVGLLFWLVGTAGMAYWQIYVIGDRTNVTLVKNLNALGQGLTTMFMLGQLVQPLGIIILAYAYTAYRRSFLLPMIIAVVFVQVVLGFAADYKSEAMSAGILLVITKTYVDGKIPKSWLLCVALFVMLVFPIFQAYRLQVRGEQGVSSAAAAQDLLGTLQKAIDAQAKVKSGFGGAEYRVKSAWERASLKSSVELIVAKTGKDSPYQMGATLTPILTAFMPKIIWSDKASLAVGQIFNKTFHLAVTDDVFISPSHVGEVYWNFGWVGTLLIMPATGFLLGFIGTRCIAYPTLSLTRLMIMIVTILSFVVRAEGSIADVYVVWLRSMAVIGLLHLAFARSPNGRRIAPPVDDARGATQPKGALATSPYPNLLR
jgi:hypothetical protein